ncbi:fungal-specific transcription factor domain-containing protein [Lipomyces orientalis]|uniref:Fungal-specific transcription factor domain-containing protein n=1 Tax=Lipomyces orientalis TaxID=1233043 RepID=A0ACC3TLF7_9ASCO
MMSRLVTEIDSHEWYEQSPSHYAHSISRLSSVSASESEANPTRRQRQYAEKRQSEDESQRPETTACKKIRKNSTRACDSCKRRKVKCDGTLPCMRCVTNKIDCTYNEKYTRGVYPAPNLSSSAMSLAPNIDGHQVPLSDQTASMTVISNLDNTLSDPSLIDTSSSRVASREGSPGAEERLHESFLGGSSNLLYSHAARVQLSQSGGERPVESAHITHVDDVPDDASLLEQDTARVLDATLYSDIGRRNDSVSEPAMPKRTNNQHRRPRGSSRRFWFSESAAGEIDAKVLSLPSKSFAMQLVAWYFDNASPTYRILHRPSVEHWIECGFYADDEPFDSGDDAVARPDLHASSTSKNANNQSLLTDRSISALLFSIWAMGCQFPVGVRAGSKQKRILQRRAEQFYLIAEKELRMVQSLVDRLTTLQAQFIMCQYLLTTSRVKASWDLLASVKNIANNLDLNRRNSGYKESSTKCNDVLYIELRKRAFWAIYTLESYMCTMLGKTLTFSDEDITVGLPALTDDCRAFRTSPADGEDEEETEPNLMYTPIAHAKLSKIIRRVLRRLYSDVVPENQEDVIDELGNDVLKWVEELPPFLRLRSSGGLKLPYSRQLDVVRLAHAHALILIYRPSLNVGGQGSYKSKVSISLRKQSHQEKCLDAALSVARMRGFRDLSGSYWYISYIYFSAATVMFVFLAQHPNSSKKKEILQCAKKLCQMERILAAQNDMARRYVSALTELWHQVRKHLKQLESEPIGALATENAPSSNNDGLSHQESPAALIVPPPVSNEARVTISSNGLAEQPYEMTSWLGDFGETDMAIYSAASSVSPDSGSTTSSFNGGQDDLSSPLIVFANSTTPPGYVTRSSDNSYPISLSLPPYCEMSDIGVSSQLDAGVKHVHLDTSGNNDLVLENTLMFGDILGNLP